MLLRYSTLLVTKDNTLIYQSNKYWKNIKAVGDGVIYSWEVNKFLQSSDKLFHKTTWWLKMILPFKPSKFSFRECLKLWVKYLCLNMAITMLIKIAKYVETT